jgi:hypothetical protein
MHRLGRLFEDADTAASGAFEPSSSYAGSSFLLEATP